MRISRHRSNDGLFEAGEAMSAMPYTRSDMAGCQTLTTYWRPSAAEIAAIQSGRLVRVEVIAGSLPPLSVEIE